MPGRGPKKARVMVVGEAPGAQEDIEGMPFVGPSGEFLTEMMERAGIDMNECYVTNVVKCRPKDNKTPSRKEVKICTEAYMGEELTIVQPEFVLMVGNSALQGLAGKSGITKHRGTLWEARGTKMFATFHPAAVLRNPRYKDLIETDLQRFGRIVRGEKSTSPDTKVYMVRTKKGLRNLLERLIYAEEISYDVETYCDHPNGTNFQEYRGKHSMIVSISFTFDEGVSFAVPIYHETHPWPDPDRIQRAIGQAIRLAEKRGAKFIAHNGKYDDRWMHAKSMPTRLTFDTMLAAHMVDENRVKGLKPLSQVLLGADAYDVGEELKDCFHMPLRKLLIYNGKDTDYTLRIYHKLRDELKAEPRTARVFTKLMMPASRMLVEVEANGIQLDMDVWQEASEIAMRNTERCRQYMLQFVPKDKRDNINFNSNPQLADWIFGDLGLPILETTDTGAPSTKESVALKLGKQHKAVAALLKYRKWAKYSSTYFLPWRKLRDHEDRIHPTYKLFGTVTGRLSCVDPNLQQVPRDPFIRSVLGSRPGWSLVVADYSQVELRIAAMLADETNMLAQFHRGEDIHMLRAMRMTGKLADDVTKEERKHAKPISFGFLYGMGHENFVDYALNNYDADYTEDEAFEVREGFFRDYPKLLSWHDRQRRLARKHARVQSPIGRIRHLPDIYSHDRGVQGEAERQAINSPVQSFASDLMVLALILLHEEMDPREAMIVGTVHDSGLFEIRDDVLLRWALRIREVMEDMSNVRRKFGTEVTVPIVADVEVGKNWSKPTHELKGDKLIALGK